MSASPALTRLTAAILAIPPQAWAEPASEPASATKEAAACLPMPEVETTQPAPPECADDGDGYDKDSSLLESARLVRIPRNLDTHSTANWTVIPHEAGQSERSDAGGWVLLWASLRDQVFGFLKRGFLGRAANARRRVIHGRPPDARSLAGWLAGGGG